MAFDPLQEDCLRLILQNMRREKIYPLENGEFIQAGMDQYQTDPDKLVVSDTDRSFHLTAKAAELADYRAPFLGDEAEINQADDRAEALLREACELDPNNWDAQRMLTALCADSNDAYVSYLLDNRDAVESHVLDVIQGAQDPYEKEYASDLALRPLIRWLAALSSHALIVGQYKLSLEVARELLELETTDPADVRFTAMLAMAKLEYDTAQLKAFRVNHPIAFHAASQHHRRDNNREQPRQDAWSLLAQMSALYKSFDFEGASHVLRLLMRTYPHSARTLFYQPEFADGIFSRVNVLPGSQDELILAVSEATPLLQEGLGAPDAACFSTWIANHELVQAELSREDERMRERAQSPRQGGEN